MEDETENDILNENIVDLTNTSGSSGSSGQPSIDMRDVAENTRAAKPAGKGAPEPLTDQCNVSLRSKRAAAVKANQRLKEMKELINVYRNYLHGWDEKHNKELEMMDDNFVWAYSDIDRQINVDDEMGLIGLENEQRMNDLVAGYQAFLGNLSQSDHSDLDQSGSSGDYEDASMIPQVGNSEMSINPSVLEHSDIQVWEADLPTTVSTGLTQPLAKLEFNLGINSSSTQRSRSGRQTLRHDYSKANEGGFDQPSKDCC